MIALVSASICFEQILPQVLFHRDASDAEVLE
jgi:hypothetical protein